MHQFVPTNIPTLAVLQPKSIHLATLFLIFFSWASLFSTTYGQGQKRTEPNYCATPELLENQRQQLDELAKLAFQIKKASGKAFIEITYVPIRPHIFRPANGKGGFDLARLNNVIALTNSYYQTNGVGIQFFFAGTTPDYIDDDALFRMFPAFNESGIAGRDATNAMNMYLVNAFSEGGLGGYAYFPADDLSTTRSFILANANSTENDLGNRLIPHELGHNFNLFHTFQGSTSSTPELVTRGTGANCDTAGDLVCDTPADPYGRSGASLTYVNGCPSYAGTATDPQGLTYSPSISNIMSYYYPCTHDFTPGQYDRMQAGLALRQTHTAYSLNYAPTAVNAPTNLQAIVGSSRNVVLTWQDNGTNEMGYFVERATSASGPFVAIGGTAPNVTYFTDTKAATPGQYFYRVRPSNTTDGALSNVTSVSVSAVPACVPTLSVGCVLGDGLNSFQINGESLSGPATGCSPNSYHEFTPASVTATPGQVLNLSGQFLNGLNSEGVSVWFDLNRDGIYTANEWLFSNLSTGAFSGRLTLPSNLTAGPMAIRVIVTRGYATGSPCVNTNYGEAEDYTIVVAPNSCGSSGTLSTTTITSNSAQLNWSSGGDVFGYELRWKALDDAQWTTVSDLATSNYTLTGLTTGTGYQWQVRSVCVNGTSAYAGQTFQTICPSPTNLSATNTMGTSAQLTWSDLGAGRTYDLAWRLENTSTWQVVEGITTNTYSLTGLREGTVYVWQVRSVCTPTGSQTFVAPVTFATAGTCRPTFAYGCTDFDGINSFAFNGVPMSQNSGCSVNGYRSYTNPVAPVTAGRPYSFSGTLLSNTYQEGISIWLDLNRNGVFENGERVFSPSSLSTGAFSGSLTIPATATPGPVTMRVIAAYGTYPFDACMSGGWGETEDYVLNIYATNVVQLTQFAEPACLNTPLPISFATTGSFGSANIFTVQLSESDGTFGASPVVLGSVSSSVGNSLTVNIPGSVQAGDGYRMRVVSSSPATTNNPSVPVRITGTCSCPTPSELTASDLTGRLAGLSWVCDASVSTYSLRWRVQGSSTWNTVNGLTSPNYFLQGLTSSTNYEWQVLANCVNGQASNWVAASVFQTPSCGTATLSGLSQTVAAGQSASMSVSFTGQGPWTFIVNRNGSGWVSYNTSVSPASFTTNVPNSSTFTLANASNACGSLPVNGAVYVTVPCTAPTNLTEANQTATSIDLRWAYLSGNQYQLQWKENTATTWSQSSTYCCSSYGIGGLQLGKTYQWRIRTICPDGAASDWSVERTFTMNCPVPFNMSEQTTPTSATFVWNYMSINNTSLTYNLQWRPAGAASWTTATSICCSSYSLTGLTSGQVYEWKLQTICPDGSTSAYSAPRSFTASCAVPTYFYGTYVTSSTIKAYWTNTLGVAYELQWKVQNTPASSYSSVAGITSVPYTVTGLSNSTYYEMRMRSVCSPTESSSYTGSYYFLTACSAPYVYTPSPGAAQALIQWDDFGSGVRYNLIWRVAGSPTSTTITSLTGGSYSLTGLSPSTAYEVQLQTICADGNVSGISSTRSFTTLTCTIPTALTLLGAAGSNTASLDWAFVPGNMGYELQWRVAGTTTWPNTATATFSDSYLTTLTPGTAYEWRVRTICSAQLFSDYSVIGSFTTTACAAPTGLYESGMGTNFIVYSWSAMSGVSGYSVRWREAGTTAWNSYTTCCSGSYNYNVVYGRSYEWQVATRCGTTTSEYSTSRFVTINCPVPFDLSESTTTTMAQLRWTYQNNASYTVQWRPQGSSTWSSANVSFSPLSVTGLTPNQGYEWRLQANCNDGSSGPFSQPRSFTTNCKAPSWLFTDNSGETSTWVYWNNFPNVAYTLRYRPSGSGAWTNIAGITDYPYNLTGLSANTQYEVQIQTNCGSPDNSPYSYSAYFQTNCTNGSWWSLGQIASIPVAYWGNPGGGTSFDLIYRVVGSPTSTTVSSLTGVKNELSYSFTGLLPNTAYEWQLVTRCPSGTRSISAWRQFTSPTCLSMYTINSGLWTEPTVWSCGRIPTATDVVEIRHWVTIPVDTTGSAQRIHYTTSGRILTESGATLRIGF